VGLAEDLKDLAREEGFDAAGIAPADPVPGIDAYDAWLAAGNAAGMDYLRRGRDARAEPARVLPGVRSVLSLVLNYRPRAEPGAGAPLQGIVARYARAGRDYHGVIREKLRRVAERTRRLLGLAATRGAVDTAPLLERAHAARAGVGVFGKNTALITPGLGSYTFLAELLVAKDLPPDSPRRNPCGSCTLCLEACPTGALTRPFELDSRRCISYWTIEHQGPVPDELAARFGDRVFGCDACLEVCPYNARPRPASEPALGPRADLASLDLVELARMDGPAFRRRFGATALARPGREGLARNAVVALSNSPDGRAREAIEEAAQDPSPVVREQATRALRRRE